VLDQRPVRKEVGHTNPCPQCQPRKGGVSPSVAARTLPGRSSAASRTAGCAASRTAGCASSRAAAGAASRAAGITAWSAPQACWNRAGALETPLGLGRIPDEAPPNYEAASGQDPVELRQISEKATAKSAEHCRQKRPEPTVDSGSKNSRRKIPQVQESGGIPFSEMTPL